MSSARDLTSSRRSFLKYSAALAAATLAAGPAARRLLAADDNAEYGGLNMGIQSYSLRDRPYDKMLAAMKDDFQLHVVEVYPNHLTGMSPAQVMEKAAAAGVTITSYGVVPFGKDDAKNRKLFDIAKTYSLKTLSCNPDDNKETFDSLEKLTAEFKVPIAIHPHGPGSTWPTAEKLKKAFEGRSTNIGLCADTGHLIRSGEDPLKVIQQFKDRTHSLHLKDFKKDDKGKWEDVPAGTANLDVDAIVKFLIQEKWKGHIYIEYEGGKPVEAVQQSLERVKAAAKKATA
jgi:sugar phosphate isomerase/epimerase